MSRFGGLIGLLAAAGAAFWSLPADAQQHYPARTVKIVIPAAPGSTTDTLARIVADQLSQKWGRPTIVENIPGGAMNIGASSAARSAPDGYTLFMSTNSPHSAVPFLMKNVGYDPVKDFAAITRMGSYTLMLCVHPSIPAKSVEQLIEYAKANPGKLSFASGNTSGVVAGETLKHWAEIDMLHVPYKSAPPALNDVLAGRVSMMFTDLTTGLPHVKAGTLRALAVTRLKRSTLIPELPTMDEAGVTGFDMDSWAGIFAPAGTPADIITLLNWELRKIIDNPEVKSNLGNVGFEAFSSSPKELEDFVKVQLGKWGKIVKDAGIQPE